MKTSTQSWSKIYQQVSELFEDSKKTIATVEDFIEFLMSNWELLCVYSHLKFYGICTETANGIPNIETVILSAKVWEAKIYNNQISGVSFCKLILSVTYAVDEKYYNRTRFDVDFSITPPVSLACAFAVPNIGVRPYVRHSIHRMLDPINYGKLITSDTVEILLEAKEWPLLAAMIALQS